MKKIILLLLTSPLFLISCLDNEDEGVALIGTWIGQFKEETACFDNPDALATTNLRCNTTTCWKLEMNEDGSFVYQKGAVNALEAGTYSGNIQRLTLCVQDDEDNICTDYVVEENSSGTLTISLTDEISGCKETWFFDKEFTDI